MNTLEKYTFCACVWEPMIFIARDSKVRVKGASSLGPTEWPAWLRVPNTAAVLAQVRRNCAPTTIARRAYHVAHATASKRIAACNIWILQVQETVSTT